MPPSLSEVDYKDFPSLRTTEDSVPKKESETNSLDNMANSILNQIDWNYWGKYLDYNKCKEVFNTTPDKLDIDKLNKIYLLDVAINKCLLIQNMLMLNGKIKD